MVCAGLARGVRAQYGPVAVCAAIESMNGARFVHDTLEQLGWEVEVADAQKVKGLAPLACKTDKIDARVLAELSRRDLVPAIWLPDPVSTRRARAGALSAVTWSSTELDRSRIASTRTLITFGHTVPGVAICSAATGRKLLERPGDPRPVAIRDPRRECRPDRRPRVTRSPRSTAS